ncbi:SMI1/KNR4 family protein [Actinokineospora cianjurensis]|uniref:SMI1/KNR4 family protein n=1 Tax=Actinokineospora cianjurensis TaxID=585224 RepID=UPI001477177E|nr:SMI1/KNR4 family protein [Actinokineospora cianjurensis]
MDHLAKLLDLSSPATWPAPPRDTVHEVLGEWGPVGAELADLLLVRNGCYAFVSAFHLFGIAAEPTDHPADLVAWNSPTHWRSEYADLADGYLFFAEDVFGSQFALPATGDAVLLFDPETGTTTHFATTLAAWATTLFDDPAYHTGYPLAQAWQEHHGALPSDTRLLPKIPFFVGGKYEVDNLFPSDSATGMRTRAAVAAQIKDLPNGTTITFRTT